MRAKRVMNKAISIAATAMIATTVLTGCGSAAAAPEAESITVTFMNQDETLGTVSATAGELLDASSYESFESIEEGEFNGWYETPTYLESSKKDLSKDIFSKDTTLYGDFRANEVAEDTRLWYVAGTSTKGSLAINNWAAAISDDEKAQFQLTSTGNPNEFSLTIDLYEGDQFQVIHDWAWDGQKGFGKFTGLDPEQMENAGGLGGTDDTSNVQVLQDGNYTITLTTNPDNEAQDTLTVVRNSDPVSEPAE